VHTKLDIYVFIEYVVHTHIVSPSHTEECHGQRRYTYLVLGMDKSYFIKNHSDSPKKSYETYLQNASVFD
jgi:hypothetical protein